VYVRLVRAGWALSFVAVIGLGACGGGDPATREPSGTFRVSVTRASFPPRQHVAGTTDLVLAVANTGDEAIPQLAITIWTGTGGAAASKADGAFSQRFRDQRLASATHPVWLPDPDFPKLLEGGVTPANAASAPSAGAVAAQTDTYTFGPLASGRSRTVVWRVTPVRTGVYEVHYEVAAGLAGNAKAVTASGGPVGGRFRVTIDAAPSGGCVVTSSERYGRCE
jgi:hypothetical protein